MTLVVLELERPIPTDVLEELSAALPYASESASNFVIDPDDPRQIRFQVAADADIAQVKDKVARLVQDMTRGWRSVRTQVIEDLRSGKPPHAGDVWTELLERGLVSVLGPGQVSLSGVALDLLEFFDRTFTRIGRSMGARKVRFPQMIGMDALNRCQYFASFPHHVTFCSHLREDVDVLAAFSRAQEKGEAFSFARGMHEPEQVGVPAACFHVYLELADSNLDAPRTVTTVARCFRYEAEAMTTLERLWDFTMREIVFVGPEAWVKARRKKSLEAVVRLVRRLGLHGWVETANDPFFVNTFVARKYYQLLTEAKYELRLTLPHTASSLAAASFNYHEDFFGRAFQVRLGGEPVHTACTAFGIERWVFAFLSQYGLDPAGWPALVRDGVAQETDLDPGVPSDEEQ